MLDLLPSQRSLRVFIAAVQQYSGISIADIRRRRRDEGKLVKGKLIVSKTKRNLDQNFRKFRSMDSMDRFDPAGKSFEKTGPPFEVDHFSRSDRSEPFLVEWIAH